MIQDACVPLPYPSNQVIMPERGAGFVCLHELIFAKGILGVCLEGRRDAGEKEQRISPWGP